MKSELLTAVSQLASEKGLSREDVLGVLESAMVSAYKRACGVPPEALTAEIDQATSDVRIFHHPTVVEVEPDGPDEIALDAARQIDPNVAVGDTLHVEVTPPNFNLGRINAQTAKQSVVQKLRELERKKVYDEFADRKDEIVHGIVQRIEQGNVLVELGRAEALMPRSEQVPTERYYPQQRIRVYVSEVLDTHRGPQIIVSRAHRFMLRRLFEQEVPEIYNGTVEIMAIAREAGARSKVAVAARQTGIDPVGSCVGMRGVRIQNVVNELGGEKIDVIEWNDEPERLVANALSPAQVTEVLINEVENTATVVVPERQLSLAIGKEGQNARLAAKLTGWRIDIKSEATIAADRAAAAEAVANATAENGIASAVDDGATEPEGVIDTEIAIDAEAAIEAEAMIDPGAATEAEAAIEAAPEAEDRSAESELQPRQTAVGAES